MRAREDKRKRRYKVDLRGIAPNETIEGTPCTCRPNECACKAALETKIYWEEMLRRFGMAETQLSRAVGAGSSHSLIPMGNSRDIEMIFDMQNALLDPHVTLTKRKQQDRNAIKELAAV